MKEIIVKARLNYTAFALLLLALVAAAFSRGDGRDPDRHDRDRDRTDNRFDRLINNNAATMLDEGRKTFRFDTFGDERFWGDSLLLHKAIEGQKSGGVGAGISPKTALSLGLKVDVDALPEKLIEQLKKGRVNLDDPAVTLALLKRNAVVGLSAFFNPPAQQKSNGVLKSLGIQCALCHSTVDNSLAFGIGQRLDGWANRDLNVGAIIASAPNVKPITDLLKIVTPTTDDTQTRKILNAWGPGMFDAELLLDGKGFRPDGKTAATLIPNAYGLAGYNQHTWTGAWGTVTYWNAFVATIEMQGVGTFFDPRLKDNTKFPIAAQSNFGNIRTNPDEDRVTKKLAALHTYQLAIPSPKPKPGIDFDNAAAVRGSAIYVGKAKCNFCHVKPLWTEPGWNLHSPEGLGLDDFQANRSPDRTYKTSNLAGLFVRENGLFMDPKNKGRYFHDGRFATLLDTVNHYNAVFKLNLTEQEKSDLVEYQKSLFSGGSAAEGG
jgi:hypothetical protein